MLGRFYPVCVKGHCSWMVIVCLTIFSFGALAVAQQVDPIDVGKEALNELGSTSWYDADRDEYRIPQELQNDDVEGRKSNWLGKQQVWNANNPQTPNLTWWSVFLSYFTPVLLYGVLPMFLLIALLFALQNVLPEPYRFLRKKVQASSGSSIDLERISDLPFTVDMKPTDPLSEARRCMESGDFEKAIVYLFAYQLLQLESKQYITLQRGKTNRVYLRELRQRSELRAILESTVLAFEQVFFGRYPLDRSRFMSCWERLDDFHRFLSPSVETRVPLRTGESV